MGFVQKPTPVLVKPSGVSGLRDLICPKLVDCINMSVCSHRRFHMVGWDVKCVCFAFPFSFENRNTVSVHCTLHVSHFLTVFTCLAFQFINSRVPKQNTQKKIKKLHNFCLIYCLTCPPHYKLEQKFHILGQDIS